MPQQCKQSYRLSTRGLAMTRRLAGGCSLLPSKIFATDYYIIVFHVTFLPVHSTCGNWLLRVHIIYLICPSCVKCSLPAVRDRISSFHWDRMNLTSYHSRSRYFHYDTNNLIHIEGRFCRLKIPFFSPFSFQQSHGTRR